MHSMGQHVTFAFPIKDVCSSLDLDSAQVSCMSNESRGDQSCDELIDGGHLAQPAGSMVQCSTEGNLVFVGSSQLPAQLGVQADPVFTDANDDKSPLLELQTATHSG